MPPKSKIEHFNRVLEDRIAETQRMIANAEQEVRASSVRQPDTADQAAAEWAGDHYTWVYKTVIRDEKQIASVVEKHGLSAKTEH